VLTHQIDPKLKRFHLRKGVDTSQQGAYHVVIGQGDDQRKWEGIMGNIRLAIARALCPIRVTVVAIPVTIEAPETHKV
jgi:hypothetical protein